MMDNKKIDEIIKKLVQIKSDNEVQENFGSKFDNLIMDLKNSKIELDEDYDKKVYVILDYIDKTGEYIPYIAEGVYIESYDASPKKDDATMVDRIYINSAYDANGNIIQNVNNELHTNYNRIIDVGGVLFDTKEDAIRALETLVYIHYYSKSHYYTLKYCEKNLESMVKKSRELTDKIDIYNRHKIPNLEEEYDEQVYCYIPHYNKKGKIDNYVLQSGTYVESYYDQKKGKLVHDVILPSCWDKNGEIIYNYKFQADKIYNSEDLACVDKYNVRSPLALRKKSNVGKVQDFSKLYRLVNESNNLSNELSKAECNHFSRKRER